MSREIEILRLCLTTPNTLPVVITGGPGIGKSSRIRQLADSMGWDSVVFSVGEVGEGMFGVVPVPHADGYLHFPAAEWVKKFSADRPGVLVLDDVHATTPALQAPLAGLILDGRIGSYQLPKSVRRVGIMNPVHQGAGGWEFAANVCNRFQYHQWSSPTGAEWSDWLLEHADHQEGRGWDSARALAATFHRKLPGRLYEDPDKVLPGREVSAYATPRSWETAVRMLAACTDRGMMEDYPALACGILGKPIGLEWMTWLQKNNLPDPEDLLADPDSWKPDPRESDKVFATCFSVAQAAIASDSHDGKGKYSKAAKRGRWLASWRVLDKAMALGKGMVVIAARILAKEENTPDGALTDPQVKGIIRQLRDVITLAGVS